MSVPVSGPFETVAAVEAYLAKRTDYERMRRFAYHERAFNLDRTRRLLSALGDPQDAYPSIHVAGTKGKGSTCHLAAAALTGCGLRTGLFTSPHLVRVTERIRIDGRQGEDALFCRAFDAVAAAARPLAADGDDPTFFELVTAAAAWAFREAAVAVAVFEVGLGGRLDATNAWDHTVSAITPVSLDHVHVLGDTVADIARDKAGILRPGTPCVVAAQTPEGEATIRDAAARQGTPLWVVGEAVRLLGEPRLAFSPGPEVSVTLRTPRRTWPRLTAPVAGAHQAANLALAAGALDLLEERTALAVNPEAAARGVARLSLPGRTHVVAEEPRIVVDGAHNPAAARSLVEVLERGLARGPLHVILALSQDKDAAGVVSLLAPAARALYATTARTPRSMEPQAIARQGREGGMAEVEAFADPAEAFEAARTAAGKSGTVVVTGSFFLAGLAYRHFLPEEEWANL